MPKPRHRGDMMSATLTTGNISSYDVVILGAGYAGLIATLRLGRQKWGLRVALVNPRAQFLERVRLQESIVAWAHAARVMVAQRAKQDLQRFRFSTLAQAAAIDRLGVIYLLNRNDRRIGYTVNPSSAPSAVDVFPIRRRTRKCLAVWSAERI